MPASAAPRETLRVALAGTTYDIQRPWGDIPAGAGIVSDVACDPQGHVFVLLRRDIYVDAPAPSVIELAPDGTRRAAWGEEVADGHMLAYGPDHHLYVVDRDAHEIIIFSRDGARRGGIGQRHVPGAPFNHPSAIAFAPDGAIYVADGYGSSRVHRFDAAGRHLGSWGEPGDGPGQFTTPHGIWVLADGRVAVTDRENNRLQIFSATGETLQVVPDFPVAMDVWQDAAGNLLVTDRVPRLSLLSPQGARLGRCRPVLFGAHGLCGDAAGNLYLAETAPSRITRLKPIAGR